MSVSRTWGSQALQTVHGWIERAAWIAPLAVFLATLAVHGVRLTLAPDLFADEALYLSVTRNIALGRGIVDHEGAVFFWHPPFYFLIGALYFKLRGLVEADVLQALFAARYANLLFSGLTASVLFLLGRRLIGPRTGLFMAAFFIVDPYVQRINRRGMLETLGVLLVVIGLYLFFTRAERLPRWRVYGSGIAIGLASLTKELLFFNLVVLLAYSLWVRRPPVKQAMLATATAAGVYLLYPLWAALTGEWSGFLDWKVHNLGRFVDLWNRTEITNPIESAVYQSTGSGAPLLENLLIALGSYATTYLLMGLGGLFLLVLLLPLRDNLSARLLVVWGGVSYAFVAVGVLVGRIGDQYFYFVAVPAVAIVGYLLGYLAEADRGRPEQAARRLSWLHVLSPLLLCMFLYNGYIWANKYVTGVDNSVSHIYYYVKDTIPAGETIGVGGDIANYLFGEQYRIEFPRTIEALAEPDIRYYLLSSKEAWGGYHGVSRTLYRWVIENARPLAEYYGPSHWTLGLYVRSAPRDATGLNQESMPGGR